MRALVVDDEPLVRSELVYALGKVARDVEVSEAPDAIEALRELAAAHFDVVFLDINLPGLSGLEATRVINAMPAAPQVVFVTAHDTHAVDAFELAAFDYVVKPVSQDRLARTIERLRSSRSSAAGVAPAQGTLARVALEDGERTRLAKVAEIRYVQANGHVVTARLFDGDLRWKGSLAEAAARLEPAGFLRVHRAYLVNPERVVEVEPFFGGSYLLRVDDKTAAKSPSPATTSPQCARRLACSRDTSGGRDSRLRDTAVCDGIKRLDHAVGAGCCVQHRHRCFTAKVCARGAKPRSRLRLIPDQLGRESLDAD